MIPQYDHYHTHKQFKMMLNSNHNHLHHIHHHIHHNHPAHSFLKRNDTNGTFNFRNWKIQIELETVHFEMKNIFNVIYRYACIQFLNIYIHAGRVVYAIHYFNFNSNSRNDRHSIMMLYTVYCTIKWRFNLTEGANRNILIISFR